MTFAQNALVLAGLLAVPLAIGAALLAGFAPGAILAGLLRRHAGIAATFAALVAASVALGAGLVAQERGAREAAARGAAAFDMIVAAPGSQTEAMLAAVYLRARALELLDGDAFARVEGTRGVALAAPLAFGDSLPSGGAVVGTTAAFAAHLAPLVQGRMFETPWEGVAGARAPYGPGDAVTPRHGHGEAAEAGAHGTGVYTVTGRLAPTGTPWDDALIVPAEGVWAVHGLAAGHADPDAIGPPWDPALFPGTPAIVAVADSLPGAYAARAALDREGTMAFFPGAVLADLMGIFGDVRRAMSVMAGAAQLLVGLAVLAGLVILARLLAPRLALLRALGAPRRLVLGLVWAMAAGIVGAGCAAGLALGWLAALVIARMASGATGLDVPARLGWAELHLAAALFAAATLAALVPAALAARRPPADDLTRT